MARKFDGATLIGSGGNVDWNSICCEARLINEESLLVNLAVFSFCSLLRFTKINSFFFQFHVIPDSVMYNR